MSGPEGTPSGGDRLAQIEAAVEITLRRARDSAGSQPEFVVAPSSVSCADVLALVEIARTLEWYAERRNYVPAAPPSTSPPAHLMATDAWDGNGPGARARSALARLDSDVRRLGVARAQARNGGGAK